MARHDDRAVKRVGTGRSLLITPPEVNLAPEQIRHAARRCFGVPFYLFDVFALFLATLVVAMVSPRLFDSPLVAALVPFVLPVFVLLVLPLGRRASARALLARVDLARAIETDLPNPAIEEAAAEYRPQWGSKSRARSSHLVWLWALAQDATTDEHGRRFRPDHGPCPGCQSPETTWCADWCDHLDRTDHR